MANERVESALSAEQWAKQSYDSGMIGAGIDRSRRQGYEISMPGVLAPRDGWPLVTLAPEQCHGVAAVLLYRQAFGFTHDDVQLLRKLVKDLTSSDFTQARSLKLKALADRIAALLPPKPP